MTLGRLAMVAVSAAAMETFYRRNKSAGLQQGSHIADYSDPEKARRLERNYQNHEVVAQRKQILGMLRLEPGEHVLDVGCGPGFMMQDLLGTVGPSGRVEGIEPAPIMIDLAKARLANNPPGGLLYDLPAGGFQFPGVGVRIGEAEKLPYGNESFDAVVLSQVLLYVHDVPRALSEAHRVLRPGGRVLICDTDWDSLVVNTSDKARLDRIRQACCTSFVDGHLPPKLPGMLAQAGFELGGVQTCAMAGAGVADSSGNSFVGNWVFRVAVDKATACGLPESDVTGWVAEQQALSASGAFCVCVHRSLFLAHKPMGSDNEM